MKRSYQQADPATTLLVIENAPGVPLGAVPDETGQDVGKGGERNADAAMD
jgi:hypothetical protein